MAMGCTASPPAEPSAFTIDNATGSIPPPGNHTYRLDGRFEAGELAITYTLTHRFRESMTPAELAALGPEDQDVAWDGHLRGSPVEAWRALLLQPGLQAPPEPAPGSDSFVVVVRYTDGSERRGTPPDRSAWRRLADAIDAKARTEGGSVVPLPSDSPSQAP